MPGRNELCPCGSGRKYKRCCAAGRQAGATIGEPGGLARLAQRVAAGDGPAAIPELTKFIRRHPEHAGVLNLLGVALSQGRRPEEASEAFEKAVAHAPDYLDARLNFAEALRLSGRVGEARRQFLYAAHIDPRSGAALNGLGLCEDALGEPKAAEAAYRRALEPAPEFLYALMNLGINLMMQGRPGDALPYFQRAARLDPDSAEVSSNLGACFLAVSKPTEALELLERARARDPRSALVAYNLGMALIPVDAGRAVETLREAVALDPGNAMAHFQLARALEQVVDLHGAIRSLRRALELRPDWLQARSSLLLLLSYDETCGHAELFREHAAFGIGQSNKAAPLQEAPVSGAEIPQPLRIGFVSADFRSHSIARLLLPVLQNLDRSAFEIHAFSNNREDDELTGRFRALIPHWHGIRGMSDLAAAELIRASGIHVLVDLSGHTDGHRLGVFARRPAPVQVTWFGYLATTGLAQMDYKITDARVDPPGLTEPQYSEKLIRLPGSLWCYQPIGPTPDVAPPPALASGRVTFGSFNNPLKIGPGVAAAWSRILNMVGGSRLLLKGRYLRSAEAKRALESLFVRHGIQPARLDIRAQSSDYLAEYADVDVALDTFPYNGGITTCDALWMGVPVVTLAGNSHAGRVGVSLLTSVGMPGLIAAAQDEYVEAAVELAGDTARLAELRGALRSRMAASPLMDAATHTRELELALAAAYRSAADRIEAECAMPDRRAEPPTWGW